MDTTIYNPANKRREQLIEEFVVRTKILNQIISDITTSDRNFPRQHYLLIGQRGSGKTTLIHRIKYAIEDDKNLEYLIPLTLGEEQYGISELIDLWEKIGEILDDYYGFQNLYQELELEINKSNDEEKCFDILMKHLAEKHKNLVLFVDNFGDLLKKLSELEIKRLREILMTNSSIRLIAASPVMIEQLLDYQKPLFEFFKTIPLKGLNNEEIKILLLKLSELDNTTEKIQSIIDNYPQRIEILRLLTGGVTRTIVSLYQIFIDNAGGTSIKDLQLTLDAVTPLYKHKMDDLPKNQQKIIDAVAKSWDATSVKEIVETTRIESKKISAQMKNLEKAQLIEKIPTNKKNHLYQIKERFFNIWYLMRYGRKYDKKRVLWLVRFLESWCTKEELENRVSLHIKTLKNGEFNDSMLLLGEAYLACANVGVDRKKELIIKYKEHLPENLTKGMSISDVDLFKSSFEHLKDANYKFALNDALAMIDKESVYGFISLIYLRSGDIENSLKYSDLAIKSKDASGLDYAVRGTVLSIVERNSEALRNFELAIEKGYETAIFEHGFILFKDGEYERAKERFIQGISYKSINGKCAHYLAHIYEIENSKKEAIKYFKKAIAFGDDESILCLGDFYDKNDEIENAIKYFKKAQKKQPEEATIKLATLYLSNDRKDEGLKELEDIKDSKDSDNQLAIAETYKRYTEDYSKAKLHYNKAIKLGNSYAYQGLGGLYEIEGDFKRAEKSYLKGYEESEDYSALFSLVELYRINRKSKDKALAHLESARSKIEFEFQEEILYSLVLVWNKELGKSIEVMKSVLEELTPILKDEDSDSYNHEFSGVIDYFIEIISYGYYDTAYDLIKKYELDEIFKPLYFVLMKYMKDLFPDEHLKMGDEIIEIVEEIITNIETRRKNRK